MCIRDSKYVTKKIFDAIINHEKVVYKIDIKILLVRDEKTMVWADGLLSTAENKTIYFAKNLQVGLFNNLTYDFGGDPSQDSF